MNDKWSSEDTSISMRRLFNSIFCNFLFSIKFYQFAEFIDSFFWDGDGGLCRTYFTYADMV